MLPESVINELFSWKHELRHIEWKRSEKLTISDKNKQKRNINDRYVATIAKAVMAMANHRGGGYIVIGVEDTLGPDQSPGVPAEDLEQWQYDQVADILRNWMQPPPQFEIHSVFWNNKTFVVLAIQEFEDQPLICLRDFGDLHKGDCYVRPRGGKIASERVKTYEDMRDLLDRAVERQFHKYLRVLGNVGLIQGSMQKTMGVDHYEAERGTW